MYMPEKIIMDGCELLCGWWGTELSTSERAAAGVISPAREVFFFFLGVFVHLNAVPTDPYRPEESH